MNRRSHPFLLCACALLPLQALAGPCDAYFSFDGSIADGGPNGLHGLLIQKGGQPTVKPAEFVAGRSGQALRLTGDTAVRAPIDLHPSTCPQVTITAWVRFEDSPTKGFQTLVSTGTRGGPSILREGQHLDFYSDGTRIKEKNALRGGQWEFVAVTWDNTEKTMGLHWRNRNLNQGMQRGGIGDLAPDIWIGASGDDLRSPVAAAAIDDIRIYGRILGADEIRQIQAGSATRASSALNPGDRIATQGALPVMFGDDAKPPGPADMGSSTATSLDIDPADRIATQGALPVMFGDDAKPPGPADIGSSTATDLDVDPADRIATQGALPVLFGDDAKPPGPSEIGDVTTTDLVVDPADRIATQGALPVMFGDDAKPPGPDD